MLVFKYVLLGLVSLALLLGLTAFALPNTVKVERAFHFRELQVRPPGEMPVARTKPSF